jgi:hypothetical protein
LVARKVHAEAVGLHPARVEDATNAANPKGDLVEMIVEHALVPDGVLLVSAMYWSNAPLTSQCGRVHVFHCVAAADRAADSSACRLEAAQRVTADFQVNDDFFGAALAIDARSNTMLIGAAGCGPCRHAARPCCHIPP